MERRASYSTKEFQPNKVSLENNLLKLVGSKLKTMMKF